MTLKTDSFAFRFFAINLGLPIVLHFIVAVVDSIGPDLRHAVTLLIIIGVINALNLTMGYFHHGWDRIGFLTITCFNIISLFAMGALSFFTSLYGWVDLVPDVVAFFYTHPT